MRVETPKPQARSRKTPIGLSLRLIGEIRLQRGGETIALPASKRTRALLGFLASTASPQPRQLLCDLLWDGPDDPRAALRWSLTKLRPLLNETEIERLQADRERIVFSPLEMAVDVQSLDQLLHGDPEAATLDEIEAAAALLQGEFLDGLDLPSCYRFHHWCLAERERWGAQRRRVLALAIARLGDEPERALPHARALVAADPLAEGAHARLVQLLGALGRRKAAQDHYDYARDLLRHELDAPLLGELRPPPLSPRRPASKAPASAPPATALAAPAKATGLVGRVAEQQMLAMALDGLRDGAAPGAMLLLGEPGIGKSRLLTFSADRARHSGMRVITARCFEAEAVRPYGCWADALGEAIEQSTDARSRRDLGLFLPSPDVPAGDDGNRTRLFAAVTALVDAIAAQQPVVLMLDDLQWIDEASSSLLHYLLRDAGNGRRLLFIGAARADEIDDNPWCRRAISALAQDGAVRRITLSPLAVAEAGQFFGPDAKPDDIVAALRQSGGNPLFLSELASAGGQASGRDLDALIGDRIARLDGAERDLIVFASATTRDFKPELLGAAMQLVDAELIDRIDRLERRGLLKPGGDGRFDFTHDLIRQATYRSLSQPRRRLIHRQIARALHAAVRGDATLAGELAYHAGAAGDHALAVRASIAAGEHCLRLFANAAAVDAADRGLGHLEQLPAGPDRAHGHVALLGIKVFAGASPGIRLKPELLDEMHEAVEAAELMGLRDDAVSGWHMISWWTQRSNDTAAAQQAILRAEKASRPTDEIMRCQQLANTGRCLLEVEADVLQARSFIIEAGHLAAGLDKNFVELDWGRALVARWDGDLVAARTCMRRALTLARLQQDRWREIECLVWLARIAVECEALGEAQILCADIDAVALRIGDGPAPVTGALRALIGLLGGDRSAETALVAVLAALRAFDDKALLAYVLNQIADCHLDHGRWRAAHVAATEALDAARAVNRTTETAVATCILARAGAGLGDRRQARATLQILTDRADAPSQLSARARTALERAQTMLAIQTPVQTVAI